VPADGYLAREYIEQSAVSVIECAAPHRMHPNSDIKGAAGPSLGVSSRGGDSHDCEQEAESANRHDSTRREMLANAGVKLQAQKAQYLKSL